MWKKKKKKKKKKEEEEEEEKKKKEKKRHSVETYLGNELTRNLSGNACPQLS